MIVDSWNTLEMESVSPIAQPLRVKNGCPAKPVVQLTGIRRKVFLKIINFKGKKSKSGVQGFKWVSLSQVYNSLEKDHYPSFVVSDFYTCQLMPQLVDEEILNELDNFSNMDENEEIVERKAGSMNSWLYFILFHSHY